jgi:hypothetical protein
MDKAKWDVLRLLSDNATYKERRRGLILLLFLYAPLTILIILLFVFGFALLLSFI